MFSKKKGASWTYDTPSSLFSVLLWFRFFHFYFLYLAEEV